MSKHTKGPWNTYPIEDKRSAYIIYSKLSSNIHLIDEVEGDANARLIAAAPELLETLDNLNVHLSKLNSLGKLPKDKKLNRLIREAFDVTIKATGETNE